MTKQKLSLLAEAIGVFCRYNIIQPFMRRPFLPRAMHIIPTHRCNARCIMCGIWKERNVANNELSFDNFEKLFEDRLFTQMEYIGISGGEPFLRKDLVKLIDLFHRKCPFLKRVSITSNGILTNKIKPALEKIILLSRKRGVLLDLSISFHALDGLLSRIYGVEGAFDKISQTLEILKLHRKNNALTFSLNCVLLNENLKAAPTLLKWARENKIPISFVLGEQRDRFDNREMKDVFVRNEHRDMLIQFFRELSGYDSLVNLSSLKYRELLSMIEGGNQRTLSCYYAFAGVLLGYDGALYYCSHSKTIGNCVKRSAYDIYYDHQNLEYRQRHLIQKECLRCPPYTRTRLELEKDIFKILKALAKEKITKLPPKKSDF